MTPHPVPRRPTADAPWPVAGTLPPVPTPDGPTAAPVERAWTHRGELFALARRVLGDRHAAEDAVQDALLAVHSHAATLDPSRPFLPWLRVVVRNAAHAHANRTRRERAGVERPEVADDRGRDPVEFAELAAQVRAATWELDPASREAFRLCYLDGLTHAQIARRLGRTVGSVSGLICRARKALRRRLAGAW